MILMIKPSPLVLQQQFSTTVLQHKSAIAFEFMHLNCFGMHLNCFGMLGCVGTNALLLVNNFHLSNLPLQRVGGYQDMRKKTTGKIRQF